MKTLKETNESELNFIGKVVKRSLEINNSTWDMTVIGSLVLGAASQNNPGKALYIVDQVNPEANSLVTDDDIIQMFPNGVDNWENIWDSFRKQDQRFVFKR